MSLDKAIRSGKEQRKKYRGAKAYDRSCRNHGDCPACFSDRTKIYVQNKPLEEDDVAVKYRTPKMTHRKIKRNI